MLTGDENKANNQLGDIILMYHQLLIACMAISEKQHRPLHCHKTRFSCQIDDVIEGKSAALIWKLGADLTAKQRLNSTKLNASEQCSPPCVLRPQETNIILSLVENVFVKRRGILRFRNKYDCLTNSGLYVPGIYPASFDAASVQTVRLVSIFSQHHYCQ